VKRVLAAAALLVVATGCGAFTDDPFRDVGIADAAIGSGGRALAIHIATCNRYELDVEETEEEVRLAARGWDDDGDCGGRDAVIRLVAPLGDRAVIDTNRDEPIDVVDCRERLRARPCDEFRVEPG
jgi:hypothetical protein